MLNQKVLDEIVTKVNELLAQSPVKDVEKNLRVMLSGMFTRLDLVTREEFEVQQEVVKRTRENWRGWKQGSPELEAAAKPDTWRLRRKRWMICRKRNNRKFADTADNKNCRGHITMQQILDSAPMYSQLIPLIPVENS